MANLVHLMRRLALRFQMDNQVLIVGKDIFAFNPGKFERMFGYEYKKQVIADKKVAEIEKEYKLSFRREWILIR